MNNNKTPKQLSATVWRAEWWIDRLLTRRLIAAEEIARRALAYYVGEKTAEKIASAVNTTLWFNALVVEVHKPTLRRLAETHCVDAFGLAGRYCRYIANILYGWRQWEARSASVKDRIVRYVMAVGDLEAAEKILTPPQQ